MHFSSKIWKTIGILYTGGFAGLWKVYRLYLDCEIVGGGEVGGGLKCTFL